MATQREATKQKLLSTLDDELRKMIESDAVRDGIILEQEQEISRLNQALLGKSGLARLDQLDDRVEEISNLIASQNNAEKLHEQMEQKMQTMMAETTAKNQVAMAEMENRMRTMMESHHREMVGKMRMPVAMPTPATAPVAMHFDAQKMFDGRWSITLKE